ncbi:hypothetical protein Tco_0770946 [Tanacetum coccineum]|uniref:Uncharacterized protein n=1 Tax=Tanacetum coccineum TaxID=301880 RepID=A0ABQ4ZEP6_9ASTR
MSKHKGVYVTLSNTKKVFANMKRPCKVFSRRVTPLFSIMIIQATKAIGADSSLLLSDSISTPIITQPSSSKPQKKKSRRKQRKDSAPTEPTTEETQVFKEESPAFEKKGIRALGLRRLRKVGSSSRVESSNDASLGVLEEQEFEFEKVVAEPVVSVATTTKSIPVSAAVYYYCQFQF